MGRNILLTVFLLFLMIMNGVLLYLVLKKPNERRRPPRELIANQLNFNEIQTQEFQKIEREHHRKMRSIDGGIRASRDYLFSNISNSGFSEQKRDSVIQVIANFQMEKEKELFTNFKQIENLCNEEQKMKLEMIVSKALRRGPGPKGPPTR